MTRVAVAVVGAGIAGVSSAYFLTQAGIGPVALVDPAPPLSLTSAQSGENYRNWWPHPVMTQFTDDSIDLMERFAADEGAGLALTRRGYALATRATDPDSLLNELRRGYGADADRLIRIHERPGAAYQRAGGGWRQAPSGVDMVVGRETVAAYFPTFDPTVAQVIHVRRAGSISGARLGQIMLERMRPAGGRLMVDEVVGVGPDGDGFRLDLRSGAALRAERIVNAAGPFLAEVAAMVGDAPPVHTVLQQKIAFEDREGAIPRDMPFAIDLDAGVLDWSDDALEALRDDASTAFLAETMPGGIHCRPDGGSWIKLGWAYNRTPQAAAREPELDPHFREIVLRGASRLHPALRTYYDRLPAARTHYGGYYTMTEENWPLIGPTAVPGVFVVGALSGFGTMAACKAGWLCAAWMAGGELPDYARALAPARYDDPVLMARLRAETHRGVL